MKWLGPFLDRNFSPIIGKLILRGGDSRVELIVSTKPVASSELTSVKLLGTLNRFRLNAWDGVKLLKILSILARSKLFETAII
jgi:hypothetical protein